MVFTCDICLAASKIWCCHAVFGSNDKSTAARNCANRSPPLHQTFPKQASRLTANGIFARRNRDSFGCRLSRSAASPNQRALSATRNKKESLKIITQYQIVMSAAERILGARNSNPGRRKFGRICQRFWFARCCGSRRLQSEWSVPVTSCAIRVGNFLPLE
jgi:hypothetical protein